MSNAYSSTAIQQLKLSFLPLTDTLAAYFSFVQMELERGWQDEDKLYGVWGDIEWKLLAHVMAEAGIIERGGETYDAMAFGLDGKGGEDRPDTSTDLWFELDIQPNLRLILDTAKSLYNLTFTTTKKEEQSMSTTKSTETAVLKAVENLTGRNETTEVVETSVLKAIESKPIASTEVTPMDRSTSTKKKRKLITVEGVDRKALAVEVTDKHKYMGQDGYWLSRGYTSDPGLENFNYGDFFANNSDPLKPNGKDNNKHYLATTEDGSFKLKDDYLRTISPSMIPFYDGVILTQTRIVSTAYFMLSCAEVYEHKRLAAFTRKLNKDYGIPVLPNVKAVMDAAKTVGANDIVAELHDIALVVQICARIMYEGDGLGGYAATSWLFYGRLFGIGCPTNDIEPKSILTDEEAIMASIEYGKAGDLGKIHLFSTWFCEIHKEYIGMDSMLKILWQMFEFVQLYNKLENPKLGSIFHKVLEDEEETWEVRDKHITAALMGFCRRAPKGLSEKNSYEFGEANRFADMLHCFFEEFEPAPFNGATFDVAKRIEAYFATPFGTSAFGEQVLRTVELHWRRNNIVDGINTREDEGELAKQQYSQNGQRTKVYKRIDN